MLSKKDFNAFWIDFSGKYPACKDYAERQDVTSVFLDGIYQSLAAFDKDVLKELTCLMLTGKVDTIPNTQLGQLGNELRIRCREVLDIRRQGEPQDWQRTPYRGTVLQEPKMSWMLRCAMAADRLLGSAGTQRPGSVRADRGSYDAAIIMADEHSATEERDCLATFAREGLTWEQIQETARMMGRTEIVKHVEDTP